MRAIAVAAQQSSRLAWLAAAIRDPLAASPSGLRPAIGLFGASELKVDVLDPHNLNLPDSVGKTQGLADYAAKHAEKLGHVDLIDDPDGTGPRRLHLERKAIRERVNAVSSRDDLRNLYLDRGEALGDQ